MKKPSLFIDTYEELEVLIAFLKEYSVISVDTEFVWTRTYFPILGIIQIGVSEENSFIIDCIKLEDGSMLSELFSDKNIVKVLHDAHQDITIINKYTNSYMTNIFDTQLASGFTGMGQALSLEKLTKQLTGVQLTKTETRTDWTQRPLKEAQLEYAYDDVRYLNICYDKLIERAEKRGTKEWLIEENLKYENIIPFDTEDAVYRQFKRNAGRVQIIFHKELFQLISFIEDEAKSRDIPREHVLKREKLPQIATLKPKTLENLKNRRVMSEKLTKRYGNKILELISNTTELPDYIKELSKKKKSDNAETASLISIYSGVIHGIAGKFEIESTLIMNKAEISEIIREYLTTDTFPEIKGWRGELLLETTKDFLNGSLLLKYNKKTKSVIPVKEKK